MIKSIRKRDGRLVDFEVDKIAGALYKAFSACFDKVELKKVYAIAHDVEKRLEEKESTLPTVELVQDTVEEILIEEGYVRVAKAYILYRDKRSRSRDMKSILLESIENESSDDINLFDVFENLMNDAMDKTRKEDLKKVFKLLKELNIDEEIIYQKKKILDFIFTKKILLSHFYKIPIIASFTHPRIIMTILNYFFCVFIRSHYKFSWNSSPYFPGWNISSNYTTCSNYRVCTNRGIR